MVTSAYITVEDAARILRMNPHTLYRNLGDVPHIRIGNLIRIPCEWVGLEPPPVMLSGRDHSKKYWQDQLPFEVKDCRRWRNTGEPIYLSPFGYPE